MVKLQLMACGLRKIFQRFQAGFQIGSSIWSISDWLSSSTFRLAESHFENHQAYIQQNDVFVGALTVEEHLFLQSKVKFCKIFRKKTVQVASLMNKTVIKKVLIWTLASALERK